MAESTSPVSAYPQAAAKPWSRKDLISLGACVLLALLLRLPGLGDVGLTHYDEGGYAMSAQASARGEARLFYPNRHLLAPPILYTLQGFALQLFGEQDAAIIGLAVLIGLLAVVAVYALTRTWFGRSAATGAGLIVAMSDYHIAYSRVGLTDMLFLTLLCAALVAYTRAERTPSLALSLLAGVLTGLAWNTKYHGWLAGVIAGAALLPRLVPALAPVWKTEPATELAHGWGAFLSGFQRILIAAAVATAMYVPWFLHIQSLDGGYAAFAAYQSDYLQPSHAVENLLAHLRFQRYIVGPSSALAPAVALLVMGTVMGRARLALIFWAIALYAASQLLSLSAVTLGLACLGALHLLRDRRDYPAFMALAFVAAFAALSPMYKAYARLLLPLITACYVLAALGLQRIALGEMRGLSAYATPVWKEWVVTAVAAALLLTVSLARGHTARGRTYRTSAGFRDAVAALLPKLPEDRDIIVVGEPVVVFYLRAQGRTVWHSNGPQDFASLAGPGQPYTLVVGRYAGGAVARYGEANPGALGEPLATAAVSSTSDVRLLDDTHPSVAARWNADSRLSYALHAFPFSLPQPASSP